MATLLPIQQFMLFRTGKSMSDMQGGRTAAILQQTLQKVLLNICLMVHLLEEVKEV
jgi:hypothetical protein